MNVPPLVRRAKALAAAAGLGALPDDADGTFLHVAAARRGIRRAAGIGIGSSVDTAWIVSALAPDAVFVVAELDPGRAAILDRLLAEDGAARVAVGDWRVVLPPEAPFDLVHVVLPDALADPDAVVGLLSPGGTVVGLDLPENPDLDAWLAHPLLAAVVVGSGSGRRALVATRVL